MKKTLLSLVGLISLAVNAQVEIEPFAPSVPGTYIGGFNVSPLTSIPNTTAWTSEGSATQSYLFVGDDGATLFGFLSGAVGNYCSVGLNFGQTLTLVSPEMDFGANTSNPTLTFRWGQSQNYAGIQVDGYCAQTLEVMYKEGAGGSWNNLITITTIDPTYTWHDEVIDLSAISDFSALYIGFKVTSVTQGSLFGLVDYGQTVIDEVVITGEPACTATTNSFSVSVCDSYTVPSGDETYTALGTQTVMDTILNMAGCDSVLTINLTVNTVDPSIMDNGDGTLTANSSGATYQWLNNCNTAPSVMSGQTGPNLNPGADGYYSCVVTQNGCTDTSACTQVVFYSIDELEQSFEIYPNPSSGEFTINLSGLSGQQHCVITDLNGKIISDQYLNGGTSAIVKLNTEAGVYVISLIDNEGVIRKSRMVIK